MRRRTFVFLLVLLGLTSAGAEMYLRNRPGDEFSQPGPPLQARPKAPEAVEAYPGILLDGRVSEVVSEEEGRVDAVLVVLGEPVTQGRQLVRLDSRLMALEQKAMKARLSAAEAQVMVAEANLKEAANQHERAGSLKDVQALMELQNAAFKKALREAELAAAHAVVQERKAELARQEHRLERRTIRAPSGGVVAELYVRQGSWVGVGTRVARLTFEDIVSVRFAVPRTAGGQLEVGQRLRVLQGDLSEPAILRRLQPDFDTALGLQTAEAQLENPRHRLRPGVPLRVLPENLLLKIYER